MLIDYQGVGIRGGIIVLPRRPNYPILSWRIIGAESVGSNPDRVVSFWTTTTPCTQFDSWKRATQWSSRRIKCTQHGVKKLWCFQNILISEFLKILLFPFWRIIIIIFFSYNKTLTGCKQKRLWMCFEYCKNELFRCEI